MGRDKLNVSWGNVDIPLCEVSVGQDEQVDNVRKTERDTREQDREEAQTLFQVMSRPDIDEVHDCLLKHLYLKKPVVARQVDC